MNHNIFFPAEWHPQSAVQIAWPHPDTDWHNILQEVTQCYIEFSKEILKRQKLLVVCHSKEEVIANFSAEEQKNLLPVELPTNDTWARDHAAISVFNNGTPTLLDFRFNAWGLKFAANFDNRITRRLFSENIYNASVTYKNHLDFVLEGGAIESDGKGTLLTTSQCLFAHNRNEHLSGDEIEQYLKQSLGVERIIWLNHGYLAGDDTDSHIDTLARFCNEKTIAYVKCENEADEHYAELALMEKELQSLKTSSGNPYDLVALPMADPVYWEERRLPATYANFLIINDAVLLPVYKSSKDAEAIVQLQKAFPDRDIIPIDCRALIKQHGSLHCVTMQYPKGFM